MRTVDLGDGRAVVDVVNLLLKVFRENTLRAMSKIHPTTLITGPAAEAF